MAGDELTRRGWHLTSEGQDQCVENGNRSADAIIKKALNLDFRDIAEKWLPTDVSTGRIKVDYLEGPSVLQVLKLRNISAPKDNEESQAAPKLWKITLTDGHSHAVAICLEPLKNLGLLTPPGTKLLLEGTVDVESSYLLLTNKNARLLGGRVTSLVESWELKRKLAQQSRQGIQTEGGPPPFVPFGRKIASMDTPRRDNFKSLAASKQAKEEEDSEFQQQRQATIAEALTAKTKTFGGGQRQNINERDLARIVEMGFSPDQASNALRQCGGNVNDAIGGLISGNFGGGRDGYGRGGGRVGGGGRGGFRERGGGDRGEQRGEDDQEDSRRGGRGGRGGRRGRGDREEEADSMSSRPSGPATLFDFLETKIPAKTENQQGSSSHNQRPQSSNTGSNPRSSGGLQQASNNRPYSASNDTYPSSRGPPQHNSGPPPLRSQPNSSASNYRGGGPSQRNGINPSRPSDSSHISGQSSESGSRPSDHSGSVRDSRGGGGAGGKDSGYRSSEHGGVGGRDSRGGAGGQHSDDFNHARRQQNLPPRLANKLGRDGNSGQGQGARLNSGRGYQDNSHDSRTRFNGGGGSGGGGGGGGGEKDQSSGANQNQGRGGVLQERNFDVGGYGNDRQQPGSYQSKPPTKNTGRTYPSGPGQNKPRFDQQRQHHQGHGRMDGPSRHMLQRGQSVLAKYWEDDQMYRAVVEAVSENGATAVVTFVDYGNQEEVLCSDIQPMPPQQNWNNSYPPPSSQGAPLMQGPGFFPGFGPPNMGAPPPFPCQEGFGSGPIPNMEFRRGGSGPSNRRPEQQDRRRPTQNFYTPPSRKKEG